MRLSQLLSRRVVEVMKILLLGMNISSQYLKVILLMLLVLLSNRPLQIGRLVDLLLLFLSDNPRGKLPHSVHIHILVFIMIVRINLLLEVPRIQ